MSMMNAARPGTRRVNRGPQMLTQPGTANSGGGFGQMYGGMRVQPGSAGAGGFGQMYGGMRVQPGSAGAQPSSGGSAPAGGMQQGGMSTSPNRLTPPANTGGAIPSFDDGGSMDDPSGFGGTANNDSSSAFDTIDQIVQYGRQKHGLTDGWRRSDNVEDDRDNSLDPVQGNAAQNRAQLNPVSAVKNIDSMLNPSDQSDESSTLAIPGTMGAAAGVNDIQQSYPPTTYKDGGAVEDDDDVTGAIPSRPAGPGGDTPDTNPFPVKRPSPPFGKRYAAGGSVDDDDDDDNGTGAIPDDGDGDDQAAPDASQQSEGMGTTPPNPQKLVSYLQGADAAPPQNVAALERAVDPQGQLDPDTRHAKAIEQAAKQGGPDAAWGVLQHYRQKYDAYKAFAAAALNGVAGKPPDIQAAAQAATQAYSYMPDGTTVQFQPAASGVTATVKRAGNPQPFGSVNLTPEQFHEFVRGKSGQFDNVMENSGPRILQQLQQSQGKPFDQAQQGGGQQSGAPQQSQPNPQGNVGRMTPPQAPSEYDFSGTQGNPQAEQRRLAGYAAGEKQSEWDPKLMARATQLFPNDRQKALQWVAEQEQQGEENQTARVKANQVKDREAGRKALADTYTASRERMNENTNITKRDIAMANAAINSGDRKLAAAAKLIASVNNSATTYDPDSDIGKAVGPALKFLRSYQYGNTGGVSQQGAPAQQGGGQQPPKPGAKQDPQGRWREKGPDGLWHLIQQ